MTQTVLPHPPTAVAQAIQLIRQSVNSTDSLIAGGIAETAAGITRQWSDLTRPSGPGADLMYGIDFGAAQGRLASLLTPEEIALINRYLVLNAATMANNLLLWAPAAAEGGEVQGLAVVQMLAGGLLIDALLDSGTETEEGARRKALEELRLMWSSGLLKEQLPGSINKIRACSVPSTGPGRAPLAGVDRHPQVEAMVRGLVAEAREKFRRDPSAPVVRVMASLYEKIAAYCRENGLPNYLMDMTIGDVEGRNFPPGLADRMALDPAGPKFRAVRARADAYLSLMAQGGMNPFRYDLSALGWPELRWRFIDCLTSLGLYDPGHQAAGSMLADGGAPGLGKAYMVAKRFMQPRGIEAIEATICFPNPALRAMAQIARDLGLTVHEMDTLPYDRFFPDATSAKWFIYKNPGCNTFLFTPVGNPNGGVADPDVTAGLLEVLNRRGMILITDLAYLGMGDLEKTRRLCEVLATYRRRIDVFPTTKIFGCPSLRSAAVVTPDPGLAGHFINVARGAQPSVSYAVQAETLARFDLVTFEDRLAMARLFRERQKRIIRKVRSIDQARRGNGLPPLIDQSMPFIGDGAIYVMVPLAPGVDSFDFMVGTGIVGTPASGFFAVSGQDLKNYIRLSVGIEGIEEAQP